MSYSEPSKERIVMKNSWDVVYFEHSVMVGYAFEPVAVGKVLENNCYLSSFKAYLVEVATVSNSVCRNSSSDLLDFLLVFKVNNSCTPLRIFKLLYLRSEERVFSQHVQLFSPVLSHRS